jgi:hypothetical protein
LEPFGLLKQVSWRYLQEREIGLDIYLSGVWAWIPVALGIASATVFLLAIFHLVPARRHSIPAILLIGLVAFGSGAAGTAAKLSSWSAAKEGPPPEIFTRGRGRPPENESQQAALLAIPAILGAAVFAESVGWAVFLAIFGGGEKRAEPKRPKGKNDD